MIKNEPSQQEEYRQAFLRHLLNRVEVVEQRIRRSRLEGWEFGAMGLIHEEVQRLTGASGRYDLIESSQRLLAFEQMLGEHIARNRMPSPVQVDRMLAQLGTVAASVLALPEFRRSAGNDEAGPATPSLRTVPSVPGEGTQLPAPSATAQNLPTGSSEAAKPVLFAWTTARHVYHLSDGNPVGAGIARHLQTDGYEVESVDSAGRLSEMLMHSSPQFVLVDPSHLSDLIAIGTTCREIAERVIDKNDRVRLVAMATQDNLPTRLDAQRAGVDALLFPPFDAADVVKQMQFLLKPEAEENVRVLIVEDDRSQAMFAETVLNNAGVRAQVELDPLHVLEALEALRPDMILMDMHMPTANGVELTVLIRGHPAFMRTPIVFLTGEIDPDMRFEAINAGGDDYLSKPIRPATLIAAVQNRVRRQRALKKHERALGVRDHETGLHRRSYLFDRVNDALGASTDQHSHVGGVLFLEIDGAAEIRDRLGLIPLEQLLAEVGRVLAGAPGEHHVAAQINENAFVVLAADLDDAALDALAQRLRERVMQHVFEQDGKPLQLRPSVGICALRFGFDDASALINTAERACRQARVGDLGTLRYEPPTRDEASPRASLASQLRDAIDSDGFGLVYQAIVAAHGGQVAQYQTLLRMRDAAGRLVPASEILPVAERAGLMIDIDRWVLSRAMNVLGQQREIGRAVRLFVPQAMGTFAAKDQDIFLMTEMAMHELAGPALVLECRLEDALLNPPALAAFAKATGRSGVQLCLVQYEHTAEASPLLERIPLAYVKLAAKYAATDLPAALRDELRALVDRAHSLGIQVIGHRVEDEQTAATLKMSGIDYIQGYLVQSPAEALDFDFHAAAP